MPTYRVSALVQRKGRVERRTALVVGADPAGAKARFASQNRVVDFDFVQEEIDAPHLPKTVVYSDEDDNVI